MRRLFYRIDLSDPRTIQYDTRREDNKIHHHVGKKHPRVHILSHVTQHPLVDKDPLPGRMLHILRLHGRLPEEKVRRDRGAQKSHEDTQKTLIYPNRWYERMP